MPYILGSALFHAAALSPLYLPKFTEEDTASCHENPSYQKVDREEKKFLEELVEDVQDMHLDRTFADFMVRSEVHVHNSEQACLENTWNMDEELQTYQNYAQIITQELPPVTIVNIFSLLHPDIFTSNAHIREDFPQMQKSSPLQARALLAAKTGEFNCKSGTLWLTALAEPYAGDALQTMLYDDHVLSVLSLAGEEIFFENTQREGISFRAPEPRGILREKEFFVIEYLVARGIPLDDLPVKYQEWYEQEATERISDFSTNTIGREAKVGIRSQSIIDELDDVPFNYPDCHRKHEGICLTSFKKEYDWKKIADLSIPSLETISNSNMILPEFAKRDLFTLDMALSESEVGSPEFLRYQKVRKALQQILLEQCRGEYSFALESGYYVRLHATKRYCPLSSLQMETLLSASSKQNLGTLSTLILDYNNAFPHDRSFETVHSQLVQKIKKNIAYEDFKEEGYYLLLLSSLVFHDSKLLNWTMSELSQEKNRIDIMKRHGVYLLGDLVEISPNDEEWNELHHFLHFYFEIPILRDKFCGNYPVYESYASKSMLEHLAEYNKIYCSPDPTKSKVVIIP